MLAYQNWIEQNMCRADAVKTSCIPKEASDSEKHTRKNSDDGSWCSSGLSDSSQILKKVPKSSSRPQKRNFRASQKQIREKKVIQAAKRKPKFSKLPDITDDFSDLLAIYESDPKPLVAKEESSVGNGSQETDLNSQVAELAL